MAIRYFGGGFQSYAPSAVSPFFGGGGYQSEDDKKKKRITEEEATGRVTGQETEFISSETGKPSGISIGGKTYLGLQPDDIKLLKEQARGGQTGEYKAPSLAQLEGLKASQKVGNIGDISSQLAALQNAPPDLQQAIAAGVIPNLPKLAAGVALTASGAGGNIAGIPAGIGLMAYATTSIYSGILNNIKTQQTGEIAAANKVLTYARSNMRQLSMLATQDPANADKYIDAYNQQIIKLHLARHQLWLEVKDISDKWAEDGRDDLAAFDEFLSEGGLAELYGERIKIALQKGVQLTSNDLLEMEQAVLSNA